MYFRKLTKFWKIVAQYQLAMLNCLANIFNYRKQNFKKMEYQMLAA